MTLSQNDMSIQFDYQDVDDIPTALERLTSQPEWSAITSVNHLSYIASFSRYLELGSHTLINAESLANGFTDLVVVLTSPTNKADSLPFETMVSASRTLRFLDNTLRWVTRGKRNIRNTIILDGQVLRSQNLQRNESRAERQRHDHQGFQVVKDTCNMVEPRVMLVCNCSPFETTELLMADLLVSSVSEAGSIEKHAWSSGAEVKMVKSFHPEFVAKCQEPGYRTLREMLFRLTVAMAVNLLSQGEIQGPGILKLRRSVLAGMQTRG